MTILCLAGYEKGHEFMREAKRQGATVVLLTSQSLQGKAEWPTESIDEIFYMPDPGGEWNRADTVKAVSYLARTRNFDRIVALDDFDVEVAAMLREHLRVPGMGETTVRYFRDKLAMRIKAAESGIRVPAFEHVLNHDRLRAFMEQVRPPWVLKPRFMAGAIGIRKIRAAHDLWPILEELGDLQSFYLMEQFIPGDIFHVDTIVYEHQVLFAMASGYGRPPMEVSHEGGVFMTRILHRDSEDAWQLQQINARVMESFGMVRGISHTEFIKPHDGSGLYFLETSARVGGAHIVDLIEAASGINLWAEWAKLEVAGGAHPYAPPLPRTDYAGLLVSLARQEQPDTSAFSDPEIVWRMNKPNHVGLIVKSPDLLRVNELLTSYTERIQRDFQAYLPPKERPSA
jgi:biotin carboxylase